MKLITEIASLSGGVLNIAVSTEEPRLGPACMRLLIGIMFLALFCVVNQSKPSARKRGGK